MLPELRYKDLAKPKSGAPNCSNNFLITGNEVVTGKSQTKALPY